MNFPDKDFPDKDFPDKVCWSVAMMKD